jgi:hypothetical protein
MKKPITYYRITYSILTESGEYPREIVIKAQDEDAARAYLEAHFKRAHTTDFIIHSIIIT